MSESTNLEDQHSARLEARSSGGSDWDGFSTWDDGALFRIEAINATREDLLLGIGVDAADCIEHCYMVVLWPIREQMGEIWTVMKVLFGFWNRAHDNFLEALREKSDSAEELAADLLDRTNEVYYQARVWSDVYDVPFPYESERQSLEIAVVELLSRRYFDKAGVQAQLDEVKRANQGLLKSLKSKAHKKAKGSGGATR